MCLRKKERRRHEKEKEEGMKKIESVHKMEKEKENEIIGNNFK